MIAKILLSPTERRLRAGWRLAVQFILMALVLFGLSVPYFLIEALLPGIPPFALEIVITVMATTSSIYISRVWVDKRSFGSLGILWRWQSIVRFLQGAGIAAIMMAAIFSIELGAGWLQIEKVGWNAIEGELGGGILAWSLIFLLVGWYEELYFRGYLQTNIADGLNQAWAIAASGFLFSFSHISNPSSSPASLMGILAAGVFFGYAYLRARNLWLPIGLHFGWNVAQGLVFGFPVSGLNTASLVAQHTTGPELITGGAFGPEAGLILLPAIMLGLWLVHAVTAVK